MSQNFIKNRFDYIFLFSVFAPFITFGLFQSDTSPFYLFLLFIRMFLLSNENRNGLYIAIIIAFLLISINSITDFDIRIIKFSAIIIIAETLYRLGKEFSNNVSLKIIKIASIFWLLSGVLTIISPNIFSFLFFRVGTTTGRGATGFTPEPSAYGISSAFLYAITLLLRKNIESEQNKTILRGTSFLFFFSCIISGSMHAIIVISLLALNYQKKIGLILLTLVPIIFVLISLQNDIRFFYLLNQAIDTGGKSLFEDASIAYRLTSFEPILNLFNNDSDSSKGSSGFGISILFINQGIIAIIWLVILGLLKSWRSYYSLIFKNASFFLITVAFMFIGPLSNPFFWLFIGVNTNLSKLSHKL